MPPKAQFNRFCQITKKRGFCWTYHDYDDEIVAHIKGLFDRPNGWVKRLVFNYEICPTTGRRHLQGCLYMRDNQTWPKLKADIGLEKIHLELAQNVEALDKYCQKSETRDPAHPEGVVLGVAPLTDEAKGQKGEEYYERNILACMNGQQMDASAEFNLRNFEYAAEARKRKRELASLDELSFEWHYGEPFSGKTHYCRKIPGAFKWNSKAGWNNYNDEEVVICDDVDERTVPEQQEIKTWCDLDPFQVKVNYKVLNIRPKRFIFTSNESIADCFPRAKPIHLKAIERRFKVYYYPAAYGEPGWVDPTAIPQKYLFTDEEMDAQLSV
ncbi:putative Rep protein [Circovirus-like genome DCCV-12]|uniref:putative Rep protein n=1 Tax=Circovirus-like genome DCCV-12 TaxID=1788440 RepID=UPI0007F9BA80|nr:putative Rep protein [Circovirus-like genome DCCV-12]AMB42989.1 putative Rep protein [Circovirus-like genome DCCV-12]